ncbi:hypothetical protein CAPTEDRAFT_199118 [Capitella teleta]|uniref:Uncharacterized protein n=1 Tax=Capitella teleta TaxID=283909 RepID=R7VCC0_CAPTE|nr:hypothetical protein CAPTEDRAFT_199118 [Capitella teleta]|eukprot:ELU13966.1 hypothetical protein CAPTEDRAFT_199118 [Capitella teleta]
MSDDISEPEKHGTPPPLEDVDLNSPEEEEAEKAICTNGDSEEVVVNGFTSTETSESEDLSEANDLKKNLTVPLNDKSASPAKSNVSSDVEVTDELLSEVDAELQEANGSEEFETLKRELEEERGQCERLRAQAAELDARMIVLRQENKGYVDRLQHQADDHIHSAQVKEHPSIAAYSPACVAVMMYLYLNSEQSASNSDLPSLDISTLTDKFSKWIKTPSSGATQRRPSHHTRPSLAPTTSALARSHSFSELRTSERQSAVDAAVDKITREYLQAIRGDTIRSGPLKPLLRRGISQSYTDLDVKQDVKQDVKHDVKQDVKLDVTTSSKDEECDVKIVVSAEDEDLEDACEEIHLDEEEELEMERKDVTEIGPKGEPEIEPKVKPKIEPKGEPERGSKSEPKGWTEPETEHEVNEQFIVMLEQTIVQLQRECKDSQEKLVSHDAAAKRAIASLQTELKQRLDNAQRMLDEARREKESMVMKYALAEQKNIEAADRVHKMEAHVREVNKEREQMLGHCRQMKADKTKAVDAYESKLAEVAALRRDIDKLKDAVKLRK